MSLSYPPEARVARPIRRGFSWISGSPPRSTTCWASALWNGSGILPRHGWFTRGNGLTAVVGVVEAEGDALARGGAAGAELHAAIPARTAAAAAMAVPYTDNLLCCGRPARAGPRAAGDGYRRKLGALFR